MFATHGHHARLLVSGQESLGRVAVIEMNASHGSGGPLHVHSREDELVYVLEGSVTFYRDGERIDAEAGSVQFLPCGSEHTFSVESSEARLLVLVFPAGLEAALTEQPTGPPSFEHLVATAALAGVSITGPARQPHATLDSSTPQLIS